MGTLTQACAHRVFHLWSHSASGELCCKQVRHGYNVVLSTIHREDDIWSSETLASTLNFLGCEVLLIDAEGHDAQRLRSIIRHCKKCPDAWPGMIQFETQGHCDTLEGRGTEWGIIRSLQRKGYLLVAYSKYDTYLVHRRRLGRDARLRRWILTWFRNHCGKHCQLPTLLRVKLYLQVTSDIMELPGGE